MEQLTLKNSGMLNIKKMYVVLLNGEPTVIYYDKDKCFDLFKSSEVRDTDEIKNKELAEKVKNLKKKHQVYPEVLKTKI